ncbi:hypothetical protein DFH08DRAFT_955718 [Mycena albidolilacea]|uniref:Uncharacterized protein n=1 Tax=Mycena albidolilacea TaxID=1033008 RepID=A0AAD7ACH9_9AGAR|nr:hypothetical protein DFH08DRAFT_955718 [Mycena albidolilacea]
MACEDSGSTSDEEPPTLPIGPTAALTGKAKKKDQKCRQDRHHATSAYTLSPGQLDRKGRIIGVLIAPPLPGEDWDSVLKAATAAMQEARDQMSFPASAYHHRRAYAEGEGFPTAVQGFAFRGGREKAGSIKASLAKNATAMEEMLDNPSVIRMATYPIHERPLFTLCYPIFVDYHRNKQTLLRENLHLRRMFAHSPFATVTANLGPASVSPPHTDFGNKADGMCLIGALGDFNADRGRHLVFWDYELIIRFPPGCSILIPSAVVTHSKTPIQDGEEHFSLIQYSAGGLFWWVKNGFQSDRSWLESTTAADIERREAECKARSATTLKKISLWKDMKVKNYTGRSRMEVWDSGDVADFSDLTDDESEAERPAKRARHT